MGYDGCEDALLLSTHHGSYPDRNLAILCRKHSLGRGSIAKNPTCATGSSTDLNPAQWSQGVRAYTMLHLIRHLA